MVVDLAALHSDDAAAVLDALEPDQRLLVEGLLREFSDFGFGVSTEPVAPPVTFDRQKFSPWLVAALDAQGGAMTDRSRAVLRAAAVKLYPAASAALSKDTRGRATLRDRLGALVPGRRPT
jgi:hypothetical protein